MDLPLKKILFDKFLTKWSKQFNMIPAIIHYLNSYSEFASKIEFFVPLDLDDLSNSQLEWISLVAQFDNPIETNFFKDYWVPIRKNRYDYFIDLSSKSLSLFETDYFEFEPYKWYKIYIIKDLSKFLLDIGNPKFNAENHFNQLDDERYSEINDLFNERDELGFAGKIELGPIDEDSIFCEGQNSYFLFEDNCISFCGVNSLLVGLLPYDYKITLEHFNAPFNTVTNVCDKVNNIKALVYLLQSVGFLSIDFYAITSDLDGCKAEFKDNTFKIIHKDKEFLNSLIDKYKSYKNS